MSIVQKEAPANLTTVLAAPDDPRLPENSVDIVFVCDVLHHIENRAAYYPKLAKALKPGGRIVVIDFYKKELPAGPHPPRNSRKRKPLLSRERRLLSSPNGSTSYYLFFERR